MLMEGLAGKLLPRGKTYVGPKALGLGPRGRRAYALVTGQSRGYPPPPPIAFHRGLN